MRLGKILMSSMMPVAEVEVPSIAPGTLMGGGHFGGRIQVGSLQYDLIVSPHPFGGFYEDVSYSIEAREPYTYWDFDLEFNASLNDGWAIKLGCEATIGDAGGPGAIFAGITLNGFSDWYVGSLHEMMIIYRNLKPGTTANNTAWGAISSAVPPTPANTASVPPQTTYVPFRTGNASALREDVYCTYSRALSGDKQKYATVSFIDGTVGEMATTDSTWARAIRRQLVAA